MAQRAVEDLAVKLVRGVLTARLHETTRRPAAGSSLARRRSAPSSIDGDESTRIAYYRLLWDLT